MNYYLNPFYPIVKTNKGYQFPDFNIEYNNELIDKCKKDVFLKLLKNSGIDEKLLKEVLTEERFIEWVEKNILVNIKIDQDSIYSRSVSYYFHKKLGNVPVNINNKCVLILGCGGIGTHVAWNLTVLGVGKIYVLDYDKVECSNLNRQILYDTEDIGEYKVDVLEKKLSKINRDIIIKQINKNITSKKDLEEVIRETNPDCIVKCLDSPLYFPKWLDEVCKKYKKTYVAGILTGTAQMIGPTYVPDKTASYCDFFNIDGNTERVFGIGPSLGFVMYQISGQLTEEVFKILIDKGHLKYTNKIVIHENITNEEVELQPKNKVIDKKSNYKKWNMLNLIVILFTYYMCCCLKLPQICSVLVGLCYIIIQPVFISNSRLESFSYTFVNLIYVVICNLLLSIQNGMFSVVTWNVLLGLVSLFYTFLGIFVLVLVLVNMSIFQLKLHFQKKRG